MAYVVIARKYRPQTFEAVAGQESAATTLRNAIGTDRVGHAYLFAGPRGVGKTTMARIFSMALNCVDGPTETPCGECPACTDIYRGGDIDVMEVDGASNRGIDEIRAIRDNAVYAPSRSRFRIYIIDEVHMLTLQAFNALLKILEEPPAHVKFIFATTRPQNIPDTIRSRCQRFDFRPVPGPVMVERLRDICLSEKAEVEDRVLTSVARRANGSMRDAQSLLDQLLAIGRGRVDLEDLERMLGWIPLEEIRRAVDVFAAADVPGAVRLVEDIFDKGRDPAEFLLQLEELLRDLLLAKAGGGSLPVASASAASGEELAAQIDAFTREEFLYLIQAVHHARRELRADVEGRILLEMVAVRLATVKELPPLHKVIEAVEPLAREGSPACAPSPPAPGPARTPPKKAVEDPLAVLKAAWPGVLKALRKDHRWGSYLADARPLAVSDRGLVLGFPKDRSFHREQAGQPKRLETIRRTFQEATGVDLPVVLSDLSEQAGDVFEGVSEEREDHSAPRPRRDNDAPIVKTALKIFDGEIVPDRRE